MAQRFKKRRITLFITRALEDAQHFVMPLQQRGFTVLGQATIELVPVDITLKCVSS